MSSGLKDAAVVSEKADNLGVQGLGEGDFKKQNLVPRPLLEVLTGREKKKSKESGEDRLEETGLKRQR